MLSLNVGCSRAASPSSNPPHLRSADPRDIFPFKHREKNYEKNNVWPSAGNYDERRSPQWMRLGPPSNNGCDRRTGHNDYNNPHDPHHRGHGCSAASQGRSRECTTKPGSCLDSGFLDPGRWPLGLGAGPLGNAPAHQRSLDSRALGSGCCRQKLDLDPRSLGVSRIEI
jgi:hypothetical protein